MNPHAGAAAAPLDSQAFRFAGHTLDALAEIAGRTPCYVYDRQCALARIARLRAALPRGTRVHYSLKANPLPALVGALAGAVDGLDVASHGELRTALGGGTPPAAVSFSGPGKRDVELAAAVVAGVVVHVESAGELERLAVLGDRLGAVPRVSVRVNPDFAVRRSGMVMGGGPQPFGTDAEAVPALLARALALGLERVGLHCYAGSQMLDADVVAALQAGTLELLCRLARESALAAPSLNLGGGFGIPYFAHEAELALERVGTALEGKIDRARQNTDIGEVVLELGRWIVGPAGIYIARVIERKRSRGRDYLVLDGGLNHHLAASGNLGQVVRRNYPIAASRAVAEAGAERAWVVGPLCTPLDVLGDDVALARLGPGDLVAVLQSGAYGASASPHGFLGHPPPVELVL